jgi:hypothetical protein
MKFNKVLFGFLAFLLVGLFFVDIVSSQISGPSASGRSFGGGNSGTASYVNYGSSFERYYSGDKFNSYWPILQNKDTCEARQDILIQVSPAGCQPAVVRSDLLAEQNVPVFCQLDALQLNPAIDVKQIRNIRFDGDYPPEIAGVGFHPARAALRTRDKLLGSPLESNIGYIVVVLKRNPNEEEQKDFLEFTLRANIEYYSGNALGIGRSEFLLQEVSDSEWEATENIRQSFFKGQYSIRLKESDPNFVGVELFKQDRRVLETRVEKGRASREVYLPGQYCQTALKFDYNELVAPEIIARLQVDDDLIDVYSGSRFLNNKCTVRKISGDEINGTVEISCGRERFKLSTGVRILQEGIEVTYVDYKGKNLGLWKIEKVNRENLEITYDLKKVGAEDFKKNETLELIRLEKEDFLVEKEYGAGADDYYKEAIRDYEHVVDNFGDERKQGGENTFGQQALEKAIDLSFKYSKEVSTVRLINRYLEIYPETNRTAEYTLMLNDLYNRDSSLAGKIIDLDDGFKTIKLRSVRTPKKKSRAQVHWGREFKDIVQGNSEEFSLGNVTLVKVENEGKVIVSVSCEDKDRDKNERNKRKTLIVGDIRESACGEVLKVTSVDFERYVKLKINPVVRTRGTTNFTVGVGVEKRAFELNPEKARKRIANLNKTIDKWDGISEKLGDVVTGLKSACFATAGILTVKNFFTGTSGEAKARQEVMRGPEGWTKKCEQRLTNNNGPYSTLTECFNKNADEINRDVQARAKAIRLTNDFTTRLERKHKTSEGGIFGGDSFNDAKAKADLLKELREKYADVPFGERVDGKENLGELLDNASVESLNYQQLRDLYSNSLVIQGTVGESTGVGVDRAKAELDTIGVSINERLEYERGLEDARTFIGSTGLTGGEVHLYNSRDVKRNVGRYSKKTLSSGDFGLSRQESDGVPAEVIVYGQKPHVVLLEKIRGKDYRIKKAYKLDENGSKGDDVTEIISKNFDKFQERDFSSYQNDFIKGEYKAKFFQTEPYAKLPAIVPFESQGFSGFYVATKPTLPVLGNVKSFESNGRPSSFWVCNIMSDGRVGFNAPGFAGDECVQFNFYTGQSFSNFPGLTEQQTKKLVADASRALEDAASQYGKNVIEIGGKSIPVGNAVAVIPGTQCQDYMSPEDCKLLFNVCDPVICPSSRCDFGGAYPVADVIQTGIVGSTLLCLPNWNEEIYVPVCLTGIKAGIDGYLSILKSHRQCLEENIETGRYVGICDQMTSVYTCQFFWEQAAPLANVLLPKLVEFATTGGQGQTHGGGEYLTVASSWKNAQDSVKFFTDNYAANSLEAFRARSIDGAGTEFCRAFISGQGPSAFDSLVEPDSPVQFHAWFSEIPFTDATVPATSHYKVFYHIFAGNDRGVAFSVYLKDPPENIQYQTTPRVVVQTGYATRGEFATETKDITAPKGYQQLCVRINDKEECGFKQVSSSFAVNYVRDSFVQDEITKTGVKTERECISGSVNPLALLNPNIQEAAQEAIDPAIYNRGVVRVCATSNPGRGTDEARFVKVGQCGDAGIGCWLDKKSVDRAITDYNVNATETTLAELEKNQKDFLTAEGKYDTDEKASNDIDNLWEKVRKKSVNFVSVLKEIDDKLKRIFWNHQKAELWFLKGFANEKVFKEKVGGPSVGPGTSRTEKDGIVKEGEIETPSVGGRILKLDGSYDLNRPPGNKINLLLGNKNTDPRVFVQGNDIKSKGFIIDTPLGTIRLRNGNITLYPTRKLEIIDVWGNGSFDKINGKNIKDLEAGIDLEITSESETPVVETESETPVVETGDRVLSFEGEYNEEDRSYILLDEKPTGIYFRGFKIFINNNSNELAGVDDDGRILFLGDEEKAIFNGIFGGGSTDLFSACTRGEIVDKIKSEVSLNDLRGISCGEVSVR